MLEILLLSGTDAKSKKPATEYRQHLLSEGDRPLQYASNITDAWQNEKH